MDSMNKEYSEMLDRYLAEDSTEIFGNFSAGHAAEIITKFLNAAEYSVEFLSGNFAESFYDNIVIKDLLKQTAIKLKKTSGKIRIITTDGVSKTLRKIIEELKKEFCIDNIEYRACIYSGNEKLKHFMVVDSKRYRLEEAHDNFADSPTCVKAEVCCNGRVKAGELLSFFDMAWYALRPKKQEA